MISKPPNVSIAINAFRYCEVKAIQVKDERAVIMPDKCILCGHCLKICPQSAKTLRSDLDMVKGLIRAGHR